MAGDPPVPPSETGFDVARRGYDQAQVDAHLARLDAQVRILATDRLATVDQAEQLTRELDEARARTERLRAQVRTLVSPPQSVQGMSERMRSMLRLAEDEVAEMLGQAETEVNKRVRDADTRATRVVAEARAEADAILAQARGDAESSARESARVRSEFEIEHRAAVAALTAEREQVEQRVAAAIAAAERQRANAWEESERQRALIEEDFVIAMDQRRAEALSALQAERLETARDAAAQRDAAAAAGRVELERAQAEARRIVAEARRQVEELVWVRHRIAEQLGSTQAELHRTIGDLTPPEQPEAAGWAATAIEGSTTPLPVRSAAEPPTAEIPMTPAAGTALPAAATEPRTAAITMAETGAEPPTAEITVPGVGTEPPATEYPVPPAVRTGATAADPTPVDQTPDPTSADPPAADQATVDQPTVDQPTVDQTAAAGRPPGSMPTPYRPNPRRRSTAGTSRRR